MKNPKQAAAIAEKGKHPVEHMSWEPSDNGGFVSHTAMRQPPRKPGAPYMGGPDADTKTHSNVAQLLAHVKEMASLGKPAQKPPASAPSQWADTANQMIANGNSSPKSSNGAR